MLQILDHAWHQVHSYRLHALPAEFWYLDVGYRGWKESIRPKPVNFRGLVTENDCPAPDLIISHLDNWCDGRYPLRGLPYRLVNLFAAQAFPYVPRVAIMHGTPDDEDNRQRILHMLANTPGGPPFLVCNSKQAWQEWDLGFVRSHAIIHGYNVDEFWSERTRRSEVVAVCSGGDMSREYHGIPLLERVMREVPVTWIGARGNKSPLPDYLRYRHYLATSLIFIHTGQRSPMPGARTEAMLSGCCVVTTNNHDAADYIEHGRTGFLADSAAEMIGILKGLLRDPRRAYKVGQMGREAAREHFNSRRFVSEWLALIKRLRE